MATYTRQELREACAVLVNDPAYANTPQVFWNDAINRAIVDAWPEIADVDTDTSLKTSTETYTADTISFAATTNVIADSATGLVDFKTGDVVTISGSTSNDGKYGITSGGVAAQFTVAESLTTEIAGDDVIVTCYPLEKVLPTGTEYLCGDLEIEGASTAAYDLIRKWDDKGGRLYLVDTPTTGKKLRMQTVKRYAAIASDPATTEVPKEYITAYCLREYWLSRVGQNPQAALAMADRYASTAEKKKRELATPKPAKRLQNPWV